MQLTITETGRYVDDKSGRTIVTYTPTLIAVGGGDCAKGYLTFACWQVFEDDPEELHRQVRQKAIANAEEVLRCIFDKVESAGGD